VAGSWPPASQGNPAWTGLSARLAPWGHPAGRPAALLDIQQLGHRLTLDNSPVDPWPEPAHLNDLLLSPRTARCGPSGGTV